MGTSEPAVSSARRDQLREMYRESHPDAGAEPTTQFATVIPQLADISDSVVRRAVGSSADAAEIVAEVRRLLVGESTGSCGLGWERALDTDLAQFVRETCEKHLETYRNNPVRVTEDYRHESTVLEAAYRQRQVIELIQNGADALNGEKRGGRIEVVLTPQALYVANEGHPITEDGVEALLYVGLSEKTDKEIGRLGVGFKSVLEVTSKPMLLSRSISLAFDSARSRKLIEEQVPGVDDDVPVMRMAEVIDPWNVLEADSDIAELMQWATTVVKLPLDRPGCDWLSTALSDDGLRKEFLLFSPHVRSVVLDDRQAMARRELTSLRKRRGTLELREGDEGEPTKWQVRTKTIGLGEDARRDGGQRFGREEVDLAWAIPHSLEDAKRCHEMWSFFPVPGVETALPGILNSAWKLSEDRGNIVRGPLNEQLLQEAAQLVLDHLSEHAPADRPGFVLELLPAPPTREVSTYGTAHETGTGWAGPVLQKRIWELAPQSPIVPAADGSWKPAGELRLWPSWINKPGYKWVSDTWQGAVGELDQWVHRTVMTDLRMPRAERLGAEPSDPAEWLEAMRSDRRRVGSSNDTLRFLLRLHEAEIDGLDLEDFRSARIVWTEGECWQSIEECRLDDAAEADRLPTKQCRAAVRRIHSMLGIAEHPGERAMLEIVRGGSITDEDAERFWTAAHSVGTSRTIEVLADEPGLRDVPVRTESGRYRPQSLVLLPGPILVSGEDPEYTVDCDFHADDAELLDLIGVIDAPEWGPRDRDSPPYKAWGRRHVPIWQAEQAARAGSRPQDRTAALADGNTEAFSHLVLLSLCGADARLRLTAHILDDARWMEPWALKHVSVAKYETIEFPSLTAWVLMEHGRLRTTLGDRNMSDVVGPSLAEWSELLPVSAIGHDAAQALEVPEALFELTEQTAKMAMLAAVDLADTAENTAPIDFLREMADYRAPPERATLAALSDRRSEVEELRAADERIWLCRTSHLEAWPEEWDFPGLERPPVEAGGDIEHFTLAEYFPSLAAAVPASDEILVWECEQVLAGDRRVGFGRRGDIYLISQGSEAEESLRWLARELLPHASAAEWDDLVTSHLLAAHTKIVERVAAVVDPGEKIELLLGADELRRAVRDLVPGELSVALDQRGPTLVSIYGSSVLKEIRHLLPEGLGAPTQWAGGARTLDFVRRLGFPDSFAGRRRAERADAERVLGPVAPGKLHDFQKDIRRSVLEILEKKGKGVVDLPTGAGKTRVAIDSILKNARSENRLGTVLWVAERDELCEQAVVQWMQLWRAHGIRDREIDVLRYWGGRSPGAPPDSQDCVVVASRQQLTSRLDRDDARWLTRADIVVIDEAHHTTAKSYTSLLRWRREKGNTPFATIGLSATPFRSDHERTEHLARLFDKSLVTGDLMGPSWKDRISWLQDNEYLSHLELRDLERGVVNPTDEEARYIESDSNLTTGIDKMSERLALDEERNAAILDSISELDDSCPVVVFAGSVAHAKVLAARLNDSGTSARPIWGELARWARRDAIEDFRAGKTRVLTNYGVLSEGFDAPKTRAVIIARLVQSDGLFLQMLGRGMRGPKNGGTTNCTLITTGERLPERFDRDGQLNVNRFDYLWSTRTH